MALPTAFKKRLQINISDSKFILGIIEKGLKLTSLLKTAFGQDEQNLTILFPILLEKHNKPGLFKACFSKKMKLA